MILRVNQKDAVDATLQWQAEAVNSDPTRIHRGLHRQATGAGKSVILGALPRRAEQLDMDVRMLVLVHRVDLVNQLFASSLGGSKTWEYTKGNFMRQTIPVGVVQADRNSIPANSKVVVACVDTLDQPGRLDSVLEKFTPTILCVDEGHRAFTRTNERYSRLISDIHSKVGNIPELFFTATDYLEDPRKRLPMGRVLTDYSMRQLMDMKVLHPTDYIPVYTPPNNTLRGCSDIISSLPNIDEHRTIAFLKDAVSADTIVPLLKEQGLNFLPFTSSLSSAKPIITKYINSVGTIGQYSDWEEVARGVLKEHGQTSNEANTYFSVLKSLLYLDKRKGGIDGIVAFEKGIEGLDLPPISAVAVFRQFDDAYFKNQQTMGRPTRLPMLDPIAGDILHRIGIKTNGVAFEPVIGKPPRAQVYDCVAEFNKEGILPVPTLRTLFAQLSLEPTGTLLAQPALAYFERNGEPLTLGVMESEFNATLQSDLETDLPYTELSTKLGFPTVAHMYNKLFAAGFKPPMLRPSYIKDVASFASDAARCFSKMANGNVVMRQSYNWDDDEEVPETWYKNYPDITEDLQGKRYKLEESSTHFCNSKPVYRLIKNNTPFALLVFNPTSKAYIAGKPVMPAESQWQSVKTKPSYIAKPKFARSLKIPAEYLDAWGLDPSNLLITTALYFSDPKLPDISQQYTPLVQTAPEL